jgi:hypothetical protein
MGTALQWPCICYCNTIIINTSFVERANRYILAAMVHVRFDKQATESVCLGRETTGGRFWVKRRKREN